MAPVLTSKTKKLLADKIQKNQARIRSWLEEKIRIAPPPLYSSVDLRDAGFKVVPVDNNLYPAGFNNICPEDLRTAPALIRKELNQALQNMGKPAPNRVLILPESHTHNAYYAENLYYLKKVLADSGLAVEIGWYGEAPSDPIVLQSASGKEVQARPIRIQDGQVSIDGFTPDVILLNNDFSGGYPTPLDGVIQPILPSHALGWHSRKKSEHFRYYNQLAAEFAEILEVDPWLLQIDTEEVAPVDFGQNQGVEEVSRRAAEMLQRAQADYDKRNISRKPFVFVKNNAGTYGMGIMVAHTADEILHLNRRIRNKMSVGKNHLAIRSVAIQEGVPTATKIGGISAEPVIYLFGCEPIGGFLRAHAERGDEDNLNSPGMVFRKLCMSDLRRNEEDEGSAPEEAGTPPILELVYGSIARLSALATGMEILAHKRA